MEDEYVMHFDVFREHLDVALRHVVGKPHAGPREVKVGGKWVALNVPPDDSFLCVSAREVELPVIEGMPIANDRPLPKMARVEAVYRKKAE